MQDEWLAGFVVYAGRRGSLHIGDRIKEVAFRCGVKVPIKIVKKIVCQLVLTLLRSVQPLVKVRIGSLYNYGRIGHLAANTELYLRRRSRSKETEKEWHVFVTGQPANRQLLTMIKRRVTVIENSFCLRLCDYVQARHPDAEFWIELPLNGNEYDEFNNIPPQLAFTEDEESRGQELLARMGILPGTPFVCFHARDKAYLDAVHGTQSRGQWAYHDYRDCDILNYLPAAEYLASLGLFAVRMGYAVERKLPDGNPRIIDYATCHRSDFGDIYLSTKCKFFLGSEGGLGCVPWSFNVPVAYANGAPPIGAAAWRHTDVFIPKKLWSRERKRFLTFREIMAVGADRWFWSQQYTAAGLEVVENTPEEILALAKEMNERLDDSWVSTEEDEELQQRYRALIPPGHRCYGFPSRVGAEFLRKNRELLE